MIDRINEEPITKDTIRDDCLTLRFKIRNAIINHCWFMIVMKDVLIESDKELAKKNHILNYFMYENYVGNQLITIRRLIDHDSRTLSIKQILKNLKKIFPDKPSKINSLLKKIEKNNSIQKIKEMVNQDIAHNQRYKRERLLSAKNIEEALIFLADIEREIKLEFFSNENSIKLELPSEFSSFKNLDKPFLPPEKLKQLSKEFKSHFKEIYDGIEHFNDLAGKELKLKSTFDDYEKHKDTTWKIDLNLGFGSGGTSPTYWETKEKVDLIDIKNKENILKDVSIVHLEIVQQESDQ